MRLRVFFFLAVSVTAFELNKPEIFYYSVTCAVLSPLLAWFLGYSEKDILRGVWGYNAILYGIAVGVLIPFSVSSVFLLIAGIIGIQLLTSLLSGILTDLPVLTLPFIIITWILCFICGVINNYPSTEENFFVLPPVEYVKAFINNYQQIFLMSGIAGGILIMAGLFACDKKTFLITVMTSWLSIFISCFDSDININQVVDGFYGYNIILVTVSVCLFAGKQKIINIFFGGGAIALTFWGNVVFSEILAYFSLPVLTLPFIIGSWVYILIQRFYAIRI